MKATITRNYGRSGIEIRFSESTSYPIETPIKILGFKYSNRQRMWYAIYSPELDQKLRQKLKELNVLVDGAVEASEEEKEQYRQQAEQEKQQAEQRKEQEKQQKANAYADTENAQLAVMSISEFTRFVREKGSRSYTVYGVRWDFMPKEIEFHNLPKGRKRPDKYSIFYIHGKIQNEALQNGVVVPLKQYFANPSHVPYSSESALSSLNRLVKEHKQLLQAPDYNDFLEYHTQKAEEEKQIAAQWEAYREKYVYPFKNAWKIDRNKNAVEVRIKKGTGMTTSNNTASIEFGSGWIIFNEPILLKDLYTTNPKEDANAKSFLDLYPFDSINEPKASNQNSLKLLKLKLQLQTQTLELLLKL